MATNKRRTPAERVQALLERQAYRTEAEVMERIKGATRPMIRAVRRDLSIDRQTCLADIRGKLAADPKWRGSEAISYALRHYGIQLGAPDVSRLRPKKTKKRILEGFPSLSDEEKAEALAKHHKRVQAITNRIEATVRGRRDKTSREIRAAVAIIKKDISKGAKKP